jgi:hypothetical protein
MIVDFDAGDAGYSPVWKCLGCGRSLFVDAARQAEDEWLQQKIMRTLQEHPRSKPP